MRQPINVNTLVFYDDRDSNDDCIEYISKTESSAFSASLELKQYFLLCHSNSQKSSDLRTERPKMDFFARM